MAVEADRLRKLPVGVVIFNGDGSRVLLVEHKSSEGRKAGLIGIPAGRPEAGERIQTTGVREVREETGLTPMRLVEMPDGGVYRGILATTSKRKRYALRVMAALGYRGDVKASEETRPIWVNTATLHRRKNLMPSVEKIVYDARDVVKSNHSDHNNGRR